MSTTIFILLVGFALISAKVCEFKGANECESGCFWTSTNIWDNCEESYPSVGDAAFITVSGNYSIFIQGRIEIDSFFLGTINGENETQSIILNDRATLVINDLSTIAFTGRMVLESATTLSGPAKLVNKGTIVSSGAAAFIRSLELENYGEMDIRAGSLSIFSTFNTYGLVDISMGDELFLFGNSTLIDGNVYLRVDGLISNPIHCNGSIAFGPNAVYHAEVIGTTPTKDFSEISVEGDVFLGGSIVVKLRNTFKPHGDVWLPFVYSSKRVIGHFDNTALNTLEWESTQCVKCTFAQDETSFGMECSECSQDYYPGNQFEFDSSPMRVPNFFPYVLPVVAIIFVVVMAFVGLFELYSYWNSQRQQTPDEVFTIHMPLV